MGIPERKIRIEPNPSLFDQKVEIIAEGLHPKESYTFYSYVKIERDEAFECIAYYTANDEGVINLTKQPANGGFYKGLRPMGLFWAMIASPRNRHLYGVPERKDARQPLEVSISVYCGTLETLQDVEGCNCVATTQVTRMFMKPGVTREVVRENGLHVFLFLPPGDGPFPGVITIDGLMPGTSEDKPALLASHGYAALGLAFYGLDGLPKDYETATFKLEYFEKALKYFQNHKKVDQQRGIGLVTLCIGLYYGLAMVHFFKGIRCMIAINGPLAAIHRPLTYKNVTFPYFKTVEDIRRCNKTNAILSRTWYQLPRDFEEAKATTFPFYNRHDVAFMFISGLDDDGQASEYYTNLAEKMLKSSKHPDYQIYRYPGAGHAFKQPYMPLLPQLYNTIFRNLLRFGGNADAHSRAQEESWKLQLDFLDQRLRKNVMIKANM